MIGLCNGDCERLGVMKCCLGLQKIMSPNEIKPRNQVIQSRKRYPLGHVVASKDPMHTSDCHSATGDMAVLQTAFLFDLQFIALSEKVVVQIAMNEVWRYRKLLIIKFSPLIRSKQ